MELGNEPGVEITNASPPPGPEEALHVHLRTVPRRSDKANPPFAALDGLAVPGGGDGPLGCRLLLGGDTAGIVFGFHGPVKPTVDGLWPLLGGIAGHPNDHRIRDLRIELDPSLTGAHVSLWPLPDAAWREDDLTPEGVQGNSSSKPTVPFWC